MVLIVMSFSAPFWIDLHLSSWGVLHPPLAAGASRLLVFALPLSVFLRCLSGFHEDSEVIPFSWSSSFFSKFKVPPYPVLCGSFIVVHEFAPFLGTGPFRSTPSHFSPKKLSSVYAEVSPESQSTPCYFFLSSCPFCFRIALTLHRKLPVFPELSFLPSTLIFT